MKNSVVCLFVLSTMAEASLPKTYRRFVYDKCPDGMHLSAILSFTCICSLLTALWMAVSGLKLVGDSPIPTVKAKEILVKVHAAAINPVDYKLPKILSMTGKGIGLDFSGEIVQLGINVQDLKVGDAVYGIGSSGTLAEYCIAEASKVSKKPASIDHTSAAALPTVGLTSLQALRDNGLVSGARLLVLGASGGCGLAGVQVRCLRAFHTFITLHILIEFINVAFCILCDIGLIATDRQKHGRTCCRRLQRHECSIGAEPRRR
jgi:hypothetical protein